MPDPATISADYTLHPGELASTLSLLVEARQPAIVYEPPGCAKSQITRQVADDDQRSKQRLQLVSPHRRFIDQGLYLPSIRSEGIDTIAVIIDTSASLPPQTLAEIWSEVREIAAEISRDSVIVLQVDAALQDAADYAASHLPQEIALKGRRFRPCPSLKCQMGREPPANM